MLHLLAPIGSSLPLSNYRSWYVRIDYGLVKAVYIGIIDNMRYRMLSMMSAAAEVNILLTSINQYFSIFSAALSSRVRTLGSFHGKSYQIDTDFVIQEKVTLFASNSACMDNDSSRLYDKRHIKFGPLALLYVLSGAYN